MTSHLTQLDADDYLNIENEVMNDDINSMSSSYNNESEVDTYNPKPIYFSGALCQCYFFNNSLRTNLSGYWISHVFEKKLNGKNQRRSFIKHRYLNF